MRRVIKTKAGSWVVGRMPKGCRLCIQGAKFVLFITGLCERGCFYCPLSEKRRGKDVVYANERPVKSKREILKEAKLMDALGTGLTGGDPSLKLTRALRYLRALKQEFGPKHHVHMYCGRPLSRIELQRLKEAGLDELRFHLWSAEPVALALEEGIYAGAELPVIPGEFEVLASLLLELEEVGCPFVNLNELEFSETNFKELKARGFEVKSDESSAVQGSEELALRLLRWAAKHIQRLSLHYCPSSLKDRFQLRNRLLRRAKRVARAFEVITEEGLVVKGVIEGLGPAELSKLRRKLVRRYCIPPELIAVDRRKRRIELRWDLAEWLAKLEPELKLAWVEEYPTYDRLETTRIPLGQGP